MQLLIILLLCALTFTIAGNSLRKKTKAGHDTGNQQKLLTVLGVVVAIALIGAWYAADRR